MTGLALRQCLDPFDQRGISYESQKYRTMTAWYTKLAKSSKSLVLVHGWEGSPTTDWFPWLAKKMSDKYQVFNMSMPNPAHPTKNEWVKHLEDHVKPSASTDFVAHSIGCMAVLRFIERLDKKVGKVVLVAPYIDNIKNYKTIQSFFARKLNEEQIIKNCEQIFCLFSDDDPYVPLSMKDEVEKRLKAETKVCEGYGHFTRSDDVLRLPQVRDFLV